MLGAACLAGLAVACIAPQRPDDTVVIASGSDLESANPLVTMHPLARQVQRHALFVTLARYDSLLVPQPYYARAWEWSDDRRTLRLRLEPSLTWHDGVRTTARDVAFTFLAARDPATGFPRASDLAALDTALAIDSATVELRWRVPQPSLPALIAELPITPAHMLNGVPRAALRGSSFENAPVGNGPFRFVSRRRGARWSFARNDAFPAALGGPPRIGGITVAVVDEATTKFAGLASGELDVAGIAPTMAGIASRDATLRVLTYPVHFGTALFFNTTRAPFDDVRVRRAVAYSVERKRIVDVALAGYATAAASAVPPESPLAWTGPTGRDTALADSLLDAAGWRRGAGGLRSRGGTALSVELLTVGSGDNVAEQLVQGDLATRGITLSIRQLELGAFLAAVRGPTRRFDVAISGVPGDLSLSQLSALFSSTQRGGGLDYTGYHTPDLDALLAAAASSRAEERAPRWHAVQRHLESTAPATWLYHSRGVQGISRRLQGVHMDLRGELATVSEWHVTGPPGAR